MLGLIALLGVALILVVLVRAWLAYREMTLTNPKTPVIVVPFGVTLTTSVMEQILPERVAQMFPFLTASDVVQRVRDEWRRAGCPDTVAVIAVLPLKCSIMVMEEVLAREISEQQEAISKAVEHYGVLEFFGRNVVTTR